MGPAFGLTEMARRARFRCEPRAVRDVLVAALTALIAALDVAALYLTALLLEARW